MSKDKQKKKLTGPWRNIHTAVWLIGLAVLAWQNWWWPGILVLVAISGIVEALLMQTVPQAFEEELSDQRQPDDAPTAPVSAPAHRAELLPRACPGCGAPIRGQDVKWTGPQSADCPFCGSNLPMQKD